MDTPGEIQRSIVNCLINIFTVLFIRISFCSIKRFQRLSMFGLKGDRAVVAELWAPSWRKARIQSRSALNYIRIILDVYTPGGFSLWCQRFPEVSHTIVFYPNSWYLPLLILCKKLQLRSFLVSGVAHTVNVSGPLRYSSFTCDAYVAIW